MFDEKKGPRKKFPNNKTAPLFTLDCFFCVQYPAEHALKLERV